MGLTTSLAMDVQNVVMKSAQDPIVPPGLQTVFNCPREGVMSASAARVNAKDW
jgi:hypothetical protein